MGALADQASIQDRQCRIQVGCSRRPDAASSSPENALVAQAPIASKRWSKRPWGCCARRSLISPGLPTSKRSIARRSRLDGRPAPASRRAGSGGAFSIARASTGFMASQSVLAASAEPRRSAKPTTLSTRTARSSATVTTSPKQTAWLAATTRRPLIRTCPEAASAAAAGRVRTIRACQSHLSIRWRSKPGTGSARLLVRLELLFQHRELGERGIRIGLAIAAAILLDP